MKLVDPRPAFYLGAGNSDRIRSHSYFSGAFLLQRLHITHDRVQIRIAQLHGGHQRPRFDCAGVLDPKTKLVVGVFSSARCNRGAAHQMGQIRPKTSARWSSAPRMAVHAGVTFKPSPASDCARVFDGGSLLGLNPTGEFLRSIYRNTEEHLGVLCSAILCTLTDEESCTLRVHPHSVGVIRNEIRFAGKL